MDTINQKLIDLYSSYWSALKSQSSEFDGCKIKPACPLLLQVDKDKFYSADLRIMYCGQETKGWGSLESSSMGERLERYRNYFLEEGYIRESGRSVFWKAVKRFQKHFRHDLEGKNIVNIWNNISKIGLKERRGMTDEVRKLERAYFPVFRQELEILQPDIIIFMTGPNRDKDIRFHFPSLKIEPTGTSQTKRQLAILNSPEFPNLTFRTYHPNYFGGFNQAMDDTKKMLTKASRGTFASLQPLMQVVSCKTHYT